MSTHDKFHFSPLFIAAWSAFLMLATLLVFLHVQGYGAGEQKNRASHAGAVARSGSTSLLPQPVRLEGNKEIARFTLPIPDESVRRKETLKVTYDLQGLCVREGAAASMTLRHMNTLVRRIPFASAGKNCHQGLQSVDIPLESLSDMITNDAPVALDISVWYPTAFSVEILSIVSYNAGSAVLGISIPEASPPIRKTFDHIQPIRPEPFATSNRVEE